MFRHTQEVAAKRLAMCTTRSKPSTKQKKNETTPSIRLRAVELYQLLTIISIESIHSPRIYQVFLFPSQDKYVNTNEYDGSREELWGKPKILYRDFRFSFFFILAWTARLKIYDRYDENIFFFRISLRQKHWSACNLQIEFNENTNKKSSITILIRLFS